MFWNFKQLGIRHIDLGMQERGRCVMFGGGGGKFIKELIMLF